jgi:hypothetical protein
MAAQNSSREAKFKSEQCVCPPVGRVAIYPTPSLRHQFHKASHYIKTNNGFFQHFLHSFLIFGMMSA